MSGGTQRSRWWRRHRQASVYLLTALALVATVATATVGGFRLHHAVLIERQTLRTERLAQAALEYEDAVTEATPARRRMLELAELRSAEAAVVEHDAAEGARLDPSYHAFLAASRPGASAQTLRGPRETLESRIAAEIARQTAAIHRVNPAARTALVAAAALAAVLVALLVWQFELERRSGRLDRDNAARAEELARLREEFVAVVSHELRTPLTSIVGYLELIEDDPLTAEQRSHLAVVLRSSQRLSELVGDLLLVAEGDRAPLLLDLTELDLAALADEAVESARPAAQAREVEVISEHAGPVPVAGDRTRLAQLIDNLVSNALKFTPERGRVTVRVAQNDGWALIEVADTGTGIAADDRARVFEPFFRSRNAVERSVPGTGLGLAIVRAIVEAHHGSIDVVDGAPAPGTTFRVHLPAT